MKRAVFTAAILWAVAGAATADDTPNEATLTDSAKSVVTSATDSARESAAGVTRAATEQAGKVADQASQAARDATDAAAAGAKKATDAATASAKKATDAARARGSQAVDYLAAQGERVIASAKAAASALGDQLGELLIKARVLWAAAMQATRDGTRTLLVAAAHAIDEDSAKARTTERLNRWEDVKKRYGFQGERPNDAISEELRIHELRVARLLRAREVADAADDARSIKRSDNLLESEYSRHHDRLLTLREEEQRGEVEP